MNKEKKPTDGFLITQFKAGNTAVITELVSRYHKDFCQKAFWITKDKEVAKDIAQECWILIINKLHALEKVDSFKSWASKIVYNKAIDEVKKRTKENNNLGTVQTLGASKSSDDDREFVKKSLLKAIRILPKAKQDIIRLFYGEGYSLSEISAFLNIPVGTVKSRLFKAREKLKLIMKNSKS